MKQIGFDLNTIVGNLGDRYDHQNFISGAVVTASHTFDVFKHREQIYKYEGKTILGSTGTKKREVDVSWLTAASESYQISSDIKDYIITEIPSVTVDFPNRNLQAFPFEEITFFDPMYGKIIYQTFHGKPVHANHENQDPLKAKGVHLDAHLEYVPKWKVWKIVTLAAWDRTKDSKLVNSIIDGKRRGYSMGCLVSNFVPLAAGTLVSTENGLQPIETISSGTVVETTGKPQKCEGFVFQGLGQTYNILLDSGFELKAEESHPIMVLNPDLSVGWKEASELKEGDVVGVSSGQNVPFPTALKFDFVTPENEIEEGLVTCQICGEKLTQLQRHLNTQHNITTEDYQKTYHARVINSSLFNTDLKYPDKMTPELASVIGYLVSEGCLAQSNVVVMTNSKKSLIDDFSKCFEKTFGISPTISENTNNNTCYESRCSSKGTMLFLEYLGLDKKRSREKRVPWAIFQSPKESIAAFLKTFWEGDGSARVIPQSIVYCSSSKKLLQDIQLLLLKFGIHGYLTNLDSIPHERKITSSTLPGLRDNGYNLMHYLVVTGDGVDKFKEVIGEAISEERKEDLSKISDVSYRRNVTWWTRIPFSRAAYDAVREKSRHKGIYYVLEDGSISRVNTYYVELHDSHDLCYKHFDKYTDLIENLGRLDSSFAKRLAWLQEHRIVWSSVYKKTKNTILEPVYCLKNVETEQNFIANGVVVHNCSICGQIETENNACQHMKMGKGSVSDGSLVYQLCVGCNFFEQSSVEDPADSTAWTDAVYK